MIYVVALCNEDIAYSKLNPIVVDGQPYLAYHTSDSLTRSDWHFINKAVERLADTNKRKTVGTFAYDEQTKEFTCLQADGHGEPK